LPDRWAGLETRTEAAYVRQALAGDWPDLPDPAPGELALICRPNSTSTPARLACTGPGTATCAPTASPRCSAALARGREPDDALWFGPRPHPGPAELAARYGDTTSLAVHPGPESVRYLWLDRARQHPA
jgi:hypothetical protein